MLCSPLAEALSHQFHLRRPIGMLLKIEIVAKMMGRRISMLGQTAT